MKPRVVHFEQPKKNSGRRCIVCDAKPAGRAHIASTWFRGDDDVLPMCEPCTRNPIAVAKALAKQDELLRS